MFKPTKAKQFVAIQQLLYLFCSKETVGNMFTYKHSTAIETSLFINFFRSFTEFLNFAKKIYFGRQEPYWFYQK